MRYIKKYEFSIPVKKFALPQGSVNVSTVVVPSTPDSSLYNGSTNSNDLNIGDYVKLNLPTFALEMVSWPFFSLIYTYTKNIILS